MAKIPKVATPKIDLTQITGAAAKAAQTATKAAQQNRYQRLSREEWSKMTAAERRAYHKQQMKAIRTDRRTLAKGQRQARRDIKAGQASELAIHQTIRQGIAEIASLGAEGVGSYAITKGTSSPNAISQNVTGGIKDSDETDDEKSQTGNGPLAKAHLGRKEE